MPQGVATHWLSLAGAVIGAALPYFMTGEAQQKLHLAPLKPPAEAFDMDPVAHELFLKLQRFRERYAKHYPEVRSILIQAQNEADDLLALEKALNDPRVPLRDDDFSAAIAHRQACRKALEQFKELIKEKPLSASDGSKFAHLNELIRKLLNAHLRNLEVIYEERADAEMEELYEEEEFE